MTTKLSLIAIAAFYSAPLLAGAAKPAAPTEAKKPAVVENVSPDQAAKLMAESPGLMVIDVRTPEEFAEGHIKGAKNIDFFGSDFAKKVAALDASSPVLFHCAAGNRSSQALNAIKDTAKFPAIYHLKAGFSGWKAAGRPIETKSGSK